MKFQHTAQGAEALNQQNLKVENQQVGREYFVKIFFLLSPCESGHVDGEDVEDEDEEEFSSADESSVDGDIDFWYVVSAEEKSSQFSLSEPWLDTLA